MTDPPLKSEPITLRVLGSLSIQGGPGPGVADLLAQSKAMALLVYLTLARPRGFHTRDRIVGMLWPEQSQFDARAALRKTLQRVREATGADAIIAEGSELLASDPNIVLCDALAMDAAIDRGALRLALDQYTGELLPGFFVSGSGAFEDWLERERAYYAERAVDAAWRLVEISVEDAQYTSASRLARVVARLAQTDERMLRRVLTMLDRLSDRAGAVEAYTKFSARLWREYETKPSDETERLIETIRSRGRNS